MMLLLHFDVWVNGGQQAGKHTVNYNAHHCTYMQTVHGNLVTVDAGSMKHPSKVTESNLRRVMVRVALIGEKQRNRCVSETLGLHICESRGNLACILESIKFVSQSFLLLRHVA